MNISSFASKIWEIGNNIKWCVAVYEEDYNLGKCTSKQYSCLQGKCINMLQCLHQRGNASSFQISLITSVGTL